MKLTCKKAAFASAGALILATVSIAHPAAGHQLPAENAPHTAAIETPVSDHRSMSGLRDWAGWYFEKRGYAEADLNEKRQVMFEPTSIGALPDGPITALLCPECLPRVLRAGPACAPS